MKLTGKCLEDFNEWFKKYDGIELFDLSVDIQYGAYISVEDVWDNLPDSFKYGVYVDFFLENEMYLMIRQKEHLYSIYIDWNGHHLLTEYIDCSTLSEARTEAIKKAVEIYNQR
jgi:hypothetical protein